ncbi:MAG: DUF2934 domain-containing protein [Terriglobia bacterium]
MKEGIARKAQKSHAPATPKTFVADHLGGLTDRVRDFIAHRAYERYARRGYDGGRELEDWFEAEAELSSLLGEEVTDAGQKILVRAPLPGFTAQQTEVGLGADRVIIFAMRRTERPDGNAKNGGSAEESAVLLKAIPLPATIDPARAVATFANEILTLELPKSA